KKDRLDDAKREFEHALKRAPKYAPAHRGMGLVLGKSGHFKTAYKSMALAKTCAKVEKDLALSYVGFMQLHTMKKDAGWLDEVQKYYKLSRIELKNLPDAPFHLGLAYLQGYRFTDAVNAFNEVLVINKSLLNATNRQLHLLKRIEAADPDSEVAKSVAILNRMTRSQVAALFVHELQLDRYQKTLATAAYNPPEPPDIQNHHFEKEIYKVLTWRIFGLQFHADGTFGPDEYVSRASYATMIADIITKIKHPADEAREDLEEKMSYDDVSIDAPYHDAAMLCTFVIGPMGETGRRFYPMGLLTGIDALLSVKKLKDKLGESPQSE
ncbi:MAG: hypothetical protein JRJ85_05285, partial [Deltaproteobacteria bacterium]|nr:hypothetical protein [Deltaproteobacteria bacterium]